MIITVRKNRNTILFDKIVVLLWLAYCIINVLSNKIIEIFGGFGSVVAIAFFLFYFEFIYGDPRVRLPKVKQWPIVLFIIYYVIIFQFVFNSKTTYVVLGIRFDITVWNMISFFAMMFSAISIIKKSNAEFIKWIRSWFILLNLITLIVSIVALSADFDLAKATATSHVEYIPFFINFSSVTAFSIIAPYIIAYFQNNKSIWGIIFFVLLIICVLFASFFIATITLLFGILVYLALKIENKYLRLLVIILMTVLTIVLIGGDLWKTILLWIADNIPMTQISIRLRQLVEFEARGTMGETVSRLELYEKSFSLIGNHPVTGNAIWNSDSFVSGHSTLLDIWNIAGIIPMGLFIYYFQQLYVRTGYLLNSPASKTAHIASTLCLILTAVLNPVFASYNIVVFWIIASMIFCEVDPPMLQKK